MIEAVAEMDDELTHKYLEGEELTVAEIKRGLRLGTLTTRIIPVLTGSALRTRASRRCSTRSSTTCPRRSTSRR